MKKIIIGLLAALLLTSCGVGTISTTSGLSDEAYISFTTAEKKPYDVTVSIDGNSSTVQAVPQSTFKTKKNLKKTGLNTITMTPGTHEVTVTRGGKVIYTKKIFISTQEHKTVAL